MRVLAFDLFDRELRERYDRLFEECPHAFIQQSSYWADAVAPIGPDRPILLLCEQDGRDVAGLPLYVYEGPRGRVATSVPQAGPLGGIFVREGLSVGATAAAYGALLTRALALAEHEEALTLTTISSPFACDLTLYEQCLEWTYLLENFTQATDLDTLGSTERHVRRHRDRIGASGYSVEPTTSLTDLRGWYSVHTRRFAELGAAPLTFDLLAGLLRELGPRGKMELLLARDGGEIAGGCLYVWHQHVIDVYMPSVASEHLDRGVGHMLTASSIERARERGARIYNWQSSPSRASGVYTFKARWGSVEKEYGFVTRLLGDASALLAAGPEIVRQEYPGHYVIPYGAFAEPSRRVFRKA